MKRIILTSILLLCAVAPTLAQRMGVWGVAFYNLENLFDYEDDPNNKGDDEYLPTGPYKWTQEKYQQKLNNMARVIGDLARPNCPGGPAVIGISEVENERVVRDLVNTSPAKEMNLKYVHYDSPDRRGIDVALIYNPRLFRYTKSSTHPLIIPDNPNFKTRDQLLVEGTMAGEHVCILVNHWPSRYGGAKSSPLREAAAALSKHIADSVRTANPSAKVIIMGDLNDDPKDASVAKVLGATRHKKDTPADGYFNATWGLYDKASERCAIRIHGVSTTSKSSLPTFSANRPTACRTGKRKCSIATTSSPPTAKRRDTPSALSTETSGRMVILTTSRPSLTT